MNKWTAIVLSAASLLSGCATTDEDALIVAPSSEAYLQILRRVFPASLDVQSVADLCRDVATDLPFRCGMSIEEARRIIKQNNDRIRRLQKERDPKMLLGRPLFAIPEENLYVYVGASLSEVGENHFTSWANGKHQFWIDMIISDGKIETIYILPGNMSIMLLPGFHLDGPAKLPPYWDSRFVRDTKEPNHRRKQ